LRDAGLITEEELWRRCVVLRRDLSAEEDDIVAGMVMQGWVDETLKLMSEQGLSASRKEVARCVIKRCTEQGLDDNMERFLPYLMGELRYW